MMMKTESEKYDKLLTLLRNSKPVLNSTESIKREVINNVSKKHGSDFIMSDAAGFLFGWIYISWVRRILITTSVCVVVLFVLQQGIILKKINYLSGQIIPNSKESTFDQADMIEKNLMTYRLAGRRFRSQTITITEKQMNQLLDSVNELQNKYKHLIKLIEDDPKLKKIVEKKLIENNRTKTNL